jgi:DNA sulfur modification protein DndB
MSSTTPVGSLLRDGLIAPRSIPAETRKRIAGDQYATVHPKQIPDFEADGWVEDRRNKKSVRMRKAKPHDIAFEDRVWAAFAKLNFTSLNRDRKFKIKYGASPAETQQVDVFAADDEVVLVIECKSAAEVRQGQFKKEIEAIQGRREGILRTIRREFPQHKVKFVLATNNYALSSQVRERIKEAEVVLMTDDVISYYIDLADHLGHAARFQLLGNLFAGQKIPNLDTEVVAIQAVMGGKKYYSFSIEPERLLKIAYILHRTEANTHLMPTYQRLIKKARLRGVTQFVDNGGFFPNSLIMSLDSDRSLRFEPFPRHIGETRAGILHLPQTFRAAYVIDGQHRLYGYADSERAAKDLIPVVAFENLRREDQVRLFMEINENQKAVPKNLRLTLEADLLYESKDLLKATRALRLRLAQRLGEDRASPLYGRIQMGENAKSPIRSLTIDAINRGVSRGGFLGTFTRSEVKDQGSFYRGSNDSTFEPLYAYLSRGLWHVREQLETQFRLGSGEGGFVFINSGIEAIIAILGDIVDHLVRTNGYNPRLITPEQFFVEGQPYLDKMIDHLEALTPQEGAEYRTMYGTGGAAKYWRRLQEAINAAKPEFEPPGLIEWILDQEQQYNEEARSMIAAIEQFMKNDIRKRLEDEHGATWLKDGLPRQLYAEIRKRAVDMDAKRDDDGETDPWDCLYLIDYKTVMTQTQEQWRRLFEKQYTPPGDERKPGGWKARSDWIVKLNDIRNDVSHGRTISEDDHDWLVPIDMWLVKGSVDNEL